MSCVLLNRVYVRTYLTMRLLYLVTRYIDMTETGMVKVFLFMLGIHL